MRTCVGCRCTRPSAELVRVARAPTGRLAVGRHLPGRGAWLCPGSTACLDRALATRAFDRAFRIRLTIDPVDRERLAADLSPGRDGPGGSEAPA